MDNNLKQVITPLSLADMSYAYEVRRFEARINIRILFKRRRTNDVKRNK